MKRAAFSPDGRKLATAEIVENKRLLRILDLGEGKDRFLADLPGYVNHMIFSPDGKRLFVAVQNHSLHCWDVASGEQLWQNNHKAAHLDVSPDGKWLCADNYDTPPLRLFDAETGKPVGRTLDRLGRPLDRLGRPSGNAIRRIDQLAFAPDGQLLAQGVASERRSEIILWDVKAAKGKHRLEGAGQHFTFTPDGRSLVSVGSLLQRWDVASGKPLYKDTREDGHVGNVLALAFTPDGRSLASSGSDGTVRLWDLSTQRHRVLQSVDPEDSSSLLAFSPDGGRLLRQSKPGSLQLLEIATGRETSQFTVPYDPRGSGQVKAAQLTADGQMLLAFSEPAKSGPISIDEFENVGMLLGWEVTTGRRTLERRVTEPKTRFFQVGTRVFSPDGRLWVSIDGKVRDMRSGKTAWMLEEGVDLYPPFVFSPDGRFFAASQTGAEPEFAGTIRVYESLTGRLLARMEATHFARVGPLSFSPDGQLLLAAGTDALHGWDCVSGQSVLHLEGRGRLAGWVPGRFATCLAISPRGDIAATGHEDSAVLLWDLTPALRRLNEPPKDLSAVDFDQLWANLQDLNAPKAHAAIRELAAVPDMALKYLAERLRPVPKASQNQLRAFVADLDSSDFRVREEAAATLKRLREDAEQPLRRALEGNPSLEKRRRVEAILEALERPPAVTPEMRRTLRAVLVLERIGSRAARDLLARLAEGASGAPETRDARAALERLAQRR
jgi:WD40 repeat protein